MALTVDQFTERCIKRAQASVRLPDVAPSTNVGIAWMALLAPIIQAAMMALMDSLGNCGQKTTTEKLALINSGTVASRYQVHLAVNRAIAEQGIGWRDASPLRVTSREAIVTEAKETPDEDLVPVLEEVNGYHFDAADAWGFAG
jgi:hypothetical protein